jgi:hypothetical protein
MDAQVKSYLMSAYNYAKSWGKKTGLFTPDRCDKAFGYLQSGKAYGSWVKYQTKCNGRHWDCQCPDRQIRGTFCKHIIALLIDRKIEQLRQEDDDHEAEARDYEDEMEMQSAIRSGRF